MADEMVNIFDPLKGVDVEKVPFFEMQRDRFLSARNKSLLFPLKPNSSVMKYFLKQLFINPNLKISSKLRLRHTTLLHIIGTPGLGKSSCLVTIKHLMDLRIKHLIEAKTEPSSIFEGNYKILYFHAFSSPLRIQAEILRNINNDFG